MLGISVGPDVAHVVFSILWFKTRARRANVAHAPPINNYGLRAGVSVGRALAHQKPTPNNEYFLAIPPLCHQR